MDQMNAKEIEIEIETLHPGHFTFWERTLVTHRAGGCVGPKTGLDSMKRSNVQYFRGHR
jgi:hypothetical protein